MEDAVKVTYAVLGKAHRTIALREKTLDVEDDQVLVKVVACSICHSDSWAFDGELPQSAFCASFFGHEWTGDVVAVGPKVERFTPGDRVVSFGPSGFATHDVKPESLLLPVSTGLGDLASLVEPIKCVTTVVRAAVPDPGDTVVVVGCGFMGLCLLSWLQNGWCRQVIALDPIAERRALALEFGATHAIDPAAGDAVEQIRAVTGGFGADVAFEFAGNAQATSLAGRCLRHRGQLVIGGGFSPDENVYLNAITIHHVPPMFSPDEQDDFRRTLEAMEAGRFPLDRLVSHRFTLSRIQDAFETAARSAEVGYLKGIVLNDIED